MSTATTTVTVHAGNATTTITVHTSNASTVNNGDTTTIKDATITVTAKDASTTINVKNAAAVMTKRKHSTNANATTKRRRLIQDNSIEDSALLVGHNRFYYASLSNVWY